MFCILQLDQACIAQRAITCIMQLHFRCQTQRAHAELIKTLQREQHMLHTLHPKMSRPCKQGSFGRCIKPASLMRRESMLRNVSPDSTLSRSTDELSTLVYAKLRLQRPVSCCKGCSAARNLQSLQWVRQRIECKLFCCRTAK